MKKICLLFLQYLLILGMMYCIFKILFYFDLLECAPFARTVGTLDLILVMCLPVLTEAIVYLSHKWLIPLKFLRNGYLK